MSDDAPILVLTSCTAAKVSGSLRHAVPAESLYNGQQHQRLMRGVEVYRAAGEPGGELHLHILSAGHGVVAGHELLRSYDQSFTQLSRGEVRDRAQDLGVPTAVGDLLGRSWRLAVLLLGDDYLNAADLTERTALGGPAYAFTSPNTGQRLPQLSRLRVIPLHNHDARRFSCGLVALKGELAGRLLQGLATAPNTRWPARADLLLDRLAARPSTGVVRSNVEDVRNTA
jgi:hypothetical protein